MREIKFRAWDEINEVMHHDFQFIKSGDEGNDWVIFKSDKHAKYDEYIKNPFFSQQLKVMQYTGLTDKNGVEIYEGYVVDVQDEGYPFVKSWNGIVKMIDGSWLIENMQGDDGEYLFNEERDVEVIGNIYEHKHLLGGEK